MARKTSPPNTPAAVQQSSVPPLLEPLESDEEPPMRQQSKLPPMSYNEPPSNGWTLPTVLRYLHELIIANDRRYEQRFDSLIDTMEQRFSAAKEMNTAALAAADRAVSKAEIGAEKRFESVNEFRNTLADQQRNLMPRSEVEVLIKSMSDKITALEKAVESGRTERSGMRGGWAYAVAAISVVIGLIGGIVGFATFLMKLRG